MSVLSSIVVFVYFIVILLLYLLFSFVFVCLIILLCGCLYVIMLFCVFTGYRVKSRRTYESRVHCKESCLQVSTKTVKIFMHSLSIYTISCSGKVTSLNGTPLEGITVTVSIICKLMSLSLS